MKRIFLGLVFVMLAFHCLKAQDSDTVLSKLNKELHQSKNEDGIIKMVWWIPTIYWEITTKGNSHISPEALERIKKRVENYTIIAVLDGQNGPVGFIQNDSNVVKLIDKKGNTYNTIEEKSIPVETWNLLGMLKPSLAEEIGENGKHIKFYFLPAANKKGKLITDPENKGEFKIQLDDDYFIWKLPLSSLATDKK